jgi:hypothetical protein
MPDVQSCPVCAAPTIEGVGHACAAEYRRRHPAMRDLRKLSDEELDAITLVGRLAIADGELWKDRRLPEAGRAIQTLLSERAELLRLLKDIAEALQTLHGRAVDDDCATCALLDEAGQ